MAIIVLLHTGLFWALTAGMGVRVTAINHKSDVIFIPDKDTVDPPPPPKPIARIENPDPTRIKVDYVPVTDPSEETNDIRQRPAPPTAESEPAEPKPAAPVIFGPQVDPRLGLTEPVYPSSDIRMGNQGTVLLSIQVLESGRVGEVRIEKSSGFQRLDDSALREARRWRFRPGTRDGVPVVMWKQLPVTFQLQK